MKMKIKLKKKTIVNKKTILILMRRKNKTNLKIKI